MRTVVVVAVVSTGWVSRVGAVTRIGASSRTPDSEAGEVDVDSAFAGAGVLPPEAWAVLAFFVLSVFFAFSVLSVAAGVTSEGEDCAPVAAV